MTTTEQTPDVAVVGGGIIGLSIAYRAQERGASVVVLDAGIDGAWHRAAGMLAPVTEAEFGEDVLLRLGLESADRYAAFCDDLGVELRTAGTMLVARDRDDAEALDRLHAFRESLGLAGERLRPSEARRREGALAPTVRLALDVPGDRAVDPRALVAALRDRVPVRRERVTDLGAVHAGQVVLAAGAWSAELSDLPLRPVRGQVLRLSGEQLVERSIRTLDGYIVPRGDGTYVLGATMEERGWDDAPTAGGVYELIRDMAEVLPGVLEFHLDEVLVGFRPMLPDNLPAIGRLADDVLVATGHGRSGVLLAPVTADLVAAQLAGEPMPDWATACDPHRFAGAARAQPAAVTSGARPDA